MGEGVAFCHNHQICSTIESYSLNQLIGATVRELIRSGKASRIMLYVRALEEQGGYDSYGVARAISLAFTGDDFIQKVC